MSYQPSRTSAMDKILMIKDLYAAVDHLEELLQFTEDEDEISTLRARIVQLTGLRRDTVASMGGDKNYACLFKHTAGAWRAAEEVWLAENDSEAFLRFMEATDIFYWVAERFLGEKLERCTRCDTERDSDVAIWGETLDNISSMRSTLGDPK